MAIKGGDLIHIGNRILVDRAQTAGPGQVNINREKIYELGNYLSLASVFDTPDLTFSLESFDASAEFESLLLDQVFSTTDAGTGVETITMADGTALRPAASKPIDVVSIFKPGRSATNAFDAVGSVSIPYLVLESLSYRFGIGENASQTASLRGDSVFYNPAAGFVQEATGTNTANQAVILANPVVVYRGDTTTGDRYALSVALASGKRLSIGADYTEVATGAGPGYAVTVTILDPVPTTDRIRIVYASTAVPSYPQRSHAPVTRVRPAAIRGRNIEVRIGGDDVTDKWTSVQNVTVDYRVTLEKDEELGNPQAVSQDYDIPEVSGTLELKPRDYSELYEKICTIAGVTAGEVAGALTTLPLSLDIILYSPDAPATPGDPPVVIKTLRIPDARFTLPGFSGRVQQKMTVTFPFESDTGELIVYKGAAPDLP